jgi:SAM-dependent methyltransferase
MNNILILVKKFYRLLPNSIRSSTRIMKLKAPILRSGLFPHDFVYDEVYFSDTVRTAALNSAPIIANSIIRDLKPGSVIDVGCGNGALLHSLRTAGCKVFGLEYADAALAHCWAKGLSVQKFDLEKDDFTSEEFFDVVISTEVAEHLPKRSADRYVDLLTKLSNTVVFTAAPPGQGGIDHVNEQPQEYWIAKFAARHFSYDQALSNSWKKEWQGSGNVEWWYFSNLMLFHRPA